MSLELLARILTQARVDASKPLRSIRSIPNALLNRGGDWNNHLNQSNILRKPYPYLMFKGAPNAADHNYLGYRISDPITRNTINIALFGGSTGYHGNRIDILKRAKNSGIKVLVLLCDVPSFGYRGNDIKNGLSMPPKMNINNFIQIIKNPTWAFNTLYFGKPNFATLKPYMPKNLNLGQLGRFMDQTFSGRLNYDRIAKIRDIWKDKLVIKGIVNELDTETSIKLGLDGIIISNHGGRQLDPGLSSIDALRKIYPKFKNKITIMMDSGIKSGPDIARSIACGAQFTFLGRSFMYGVGALGKSGGDHTIEILNTQLNQIMEQLSCENILDLKNHLIN